MRTMSPSSSVTGRPPISSSLTISTLATVDLPEPDRPVKKTVNPWRWRGGWVFRSSLATSGKVNHSGISRPSASRSRSSVPDRVSTRAPSSTSSSGR